MEPIMCYPVMNSNLHFFWYPDMHAVHDVAARSLTAGRSDWEAEHDFSPIKSPDFWRPPANLNELPSVCMETCDCVTSPRTINCFDRGLDEMNAPGMPTSPYGTCPESDDGKTVCGETRSTKSPYAGFQTVVFDANDFTILTRRFGLTLHRDILMLGFWFNSIVSIDGNTFQHLKRLFALNIMANSLTKIIPGQYMGLESLECLWTGFGEQESAAKDWWHTGVTEDGNYTIGKGFPLLNWYVEMHTGSFF